MLLTMCMLAEPSVMAMAKSESEVQEAETVESAENTETSKAETEIQPGERTATIMVVSITGNELTYYEVEDETEMKVESEETEQSETDVDTESEESEISTDTDKKTEAVEKDAQTDDAEPEDTEGTSVQKDSSMTPPGGKQQNGSDSEDIPSGGVSKDGRSEQQDTKNVYLPVPVVVHTDTDEKRTFSILEAGDRLQVTIVTEEDGNETITEIWMLKE